MTVSADAAAEDKPKSEALKRFEDNCQDVLAFLERLGSDELLRTGEGYGESIGKVQKQFDEAHIDKEAIIELAREAQVVTDAVRNWIAFYFPAVRWMTVMLVSFLEAYLEDGLISIAVKNPKLIKGTPIDPIRPFEVDNIEDIRREIIKTWAHDALRPDGPPKWIRKLHDLGAPKLVKKEAILQQLTHLWHTRNLITHASCIADRNYIKNYYADGGLKEGEMVIVNLPLFKKWLHAVGPFIEWSDTFFLSYEGLNKRSK